VQRIVIVFGKEATTSLRALIRACIAKIDSV
jgi:hypothetical protein